MQKEKSTLDFVLQCVNEDQYYRKGYLDSIKHMYPDSSKKSKDYWVLLREQDQRVQKKLIS